jgi:integrase/recombinase XerD
LTRFSKGRKERICPLWPDTAKALRRLEDRWARPDSYVFRSARGQPLSRDGAAYILEKHLQLAARELPALKRKHVTPHVMRHSCAVALLQAGVDLTVIRDYLGHESIATTGRYTRTNLRMKRRVLEDFWRRAGLTNTSEPKWQAPPDVLAFLRSL